MPLSPTFLLRIDSKSTSISSTSFEETISIGEIVESYDDTPDETLDEISISTEQVTVFFDHWLGHITPSLRVYAWDPDEVSPSGRRHIAGGAAFLQDVSEDLYVDFGLSEIQAPDTTNTRALTFGLSQESGIFSMTNLRLWHQSSSGLGNYPDDYSINAYISDQWFQGSGVASGIGSLLSSTDPLTQQIFRADGSPWIDGGASLNGEYPLIDANTSQFVYLSVNVGPTFNSGAYGNGGTGSIGLRATYEYTIGAHHALPFPPKTGRLNFA